MLSFWNVSCKYLHSGILLSLWQYRKTIYYSRQLYMWAYRNYWLPGFGSLYADAWPLVRLWLLLHEIYRWLVSHAVFFCTCRYDVFELDPPRLQYKISLQLLEFNGVGKDPQSGQEFVNWTTVSTFSLTPARTLSRSKNGRVRHNT